MTPDQAVTIAFHSAANCVSVIDRKVQSLDWAGVSKTSHRAELMQIAAKFVRANASIAATNSASVLALSLYGYLAGGAYIDVDPLRDRSDLTSNAYIVFVTVLLALDAAALEVEAQLETLRILTAPTPIAAVYTDNVHPDDRFDRGLVDIDELVSYAPRNTGRRI